MYEYRAVVLKVIDADTLDVRVDLGFRIFQEMRIRLLGIDAWETRGDEKEMGKKAKEWLSARLLPFSEVTIRTEKDKQGKYGRYLAIVLVPENGGLTNLNIELVKCGHAQLVDY